MFIKRNETRGKNGFVLSCKGIYHEFLTEEEHPREIFKMWMRALNQWVIRTENLKKFIILKEVGSGGQGQVYKIAPKKKQETT